MAGAPRCARCISFGAIARAWWETCFRRSPICCFSAGWPAGAASARIPAWAARLCAVTLSLSLVHFLIRTALSARIYGWRFAAGVLPRMFWGNLLNSAATVSALRQFAAARLRGRALAWRKTDHKYPACRTPGQGRLGELLVRMRAISFEDLQAALATCPPDMRLGEHLLKLRKLQEEQLYQALSTQAGLELGAPDGGEVVRAATHALPAETVRRFSVLPYRVDFGQLHLLTPEVPSPRMTRELAALLRARPALPPGPPQGIRSPLRPLSGVIV